MKDALQRFLQDHRGIALLMVLLVLGMGTLLLVPTLQYATTALRTYRINQEATWARYALDAVTQQALWKLQYDTVFDCDGTPTPFSNCVAKKKTWYLTTQALPVGTPYTQIEKINNQDVTLSVEVPGVSITPIPIPTPLSSGACLYPTVSKDKDWVQVGEAITYTIGVDLCTTGNANFQSRQIVVHLPSGFIYVASSTIYGEFDTVPTAGNPAGDPDSSTCASIAPTSPYYALCTAADTTIVLVWPSDATDPLFDKSFGQAGFNQLSNSYQSPNCAVLAGVDPPTKCPDRLTFQAKPSSWGVFFVDVQICYFTAGSPCASGNDYKVSKVAPVVVGMFNLNGQGKGLQKKASSSLDSNGSNLVSENVP